MQVVDLQDLPGTGETTNMTPQNARGADTGFLGAGTARSEAANCAWRRQGKLQGEHEIRAGLERRGDLHQAQRRGKGVLVKEKIVSRTWGGLLGLLGSFPPKTLKILGWNPSGLSLLCRML